MAKRVLRQAKTDAEWQRALEEFDRELAACNAEPDQDTSWWDDVPEDDDMDEDDENDTRVIIHTK
jgi:hypothetical protein